MRRRLTAVPSGATAEQYDPWKFDDGSGYSRDKFYMSSKDEHGHYERVTIKMPDDVVARMKGMVADDQFPYESPQDFVRDAINHRLRDLQEMGYLRDPEVMAWARMQLMACGIATSQALADGFYRMLEEARARLQWTRQQGDDDGFTEAMGMVKLAIEDQREPYRGKLMALVQEFGGGNGGAG